MKIIAPAVLLALLSATNARFLDASNTAQTVALTYGTTTFASSMNCGQCIGLGYHFCIQKAENTVLNAYPTGTVCVQPQTGGATTTNMMDGAWSCSNAFADKAYAKYVCQVNTTPCGLTQSYNVNSNQTIAINTLQLGQTCFYKLSAACGAIGFQPSDTSKVEIEYVEFRQEQVNSTDPVVLSGVSGTGKGSLDVAKRGSAPVIGMPRRDHYFFAEVGGNSIPSGNLTAYTTSANNGTIWGRSGRYDEVATGRKVYGNPTQGSASLGFASDMSQPNCLTRNVYLAVTATAADATLNIDLTNVAFYNTT